MEMKKENAALVNRLLDLITAQQLREAEQHLRFLGLRVEEYQKRKIFLEHTRPFFFEYRKRRKYQEEIAECEKKIEEGYRKMERQTEVIESLYDQLKK